MGQSPFAKFHAEATAGWFGWKAGTYELVGPKVQGNPESLSRHVLLSHARAEAIYLLPFAGANSIRTTVRALAASGWEGIVWHHPDGHMAKLKARDLIGGHNE